MQWPEAIGSDHVRRLIDILKPHVGGKCSIQIGYRGKGASAALLLDEQWLVRPTEELFEQLKRFVGPENLRVVYGARGVGEESGSSIGRNIN